MPGSVTRSSRPLEALEQACAATGLDSQDARLLRLGSNAVYRLKAPVIVRVSRPGADAGHAAGR
jgi:hypothetical protein